MRDLSASKILLRIFNLIIYIAVMCGIIFAELTDFFHSADCENLFSNYMKVIIVCAMPLIALMLVSLVLRYALRDKSKVLIYRILDTIVRIICAIPLTFVAVYYISTKLQLDVLINIAVGIAVFFVISGILRFTLQETLDVSFIGDDEL